MFRDNHFAALDLGSTKVAVTGYPQKVFYELEKTTLKVPDIGMSYIMPSGLERVFKEVKDLLPPQIIFLGITGLNHSLVVEKRNGGGRLGGNIGDDPSLSPRDGLPKSLAPVFTEENTEPHSSVRKLLGVLAHPESVEVLYGHDRINPDDLYFSTLLSFMAGKFAGEDVGVSPGESKDFKLGEISKAGLDFHQLFGLTKDRILFANKEIIDLGKGKRIQIVPDINVEVQVLSRLGKSGLIPEESMILATDGVLKRISQNGSSGGKMIEDYYYETMRKMGNTGPKVIMPAMASRGLINKYDSNAMFEMFEKAMRGTQMPKKWLYDPWADKQNGVLWRKVGKRWQQITESSLINLESDDFWEAVRAYGWGMGSAMYEGVSPLVPNVVIYGGLMCLFGEMQPGWSHVFKQAAHEGAMVHWLKMTDAGMALKLLMMESEGILIDWDKAVPIRALQKGGGMVNKWLEMKAEIKGQGVYF